MTSEEVAIVNTNLPNNLLDDLIYNPRRICILLSSIHHS